MPLCHHNISKNLSYDLTLLPLPVADPGFPVGGGVDLVGGAWTPEAAMFHKICMSKRKNWSLGGVPRRVCPPGSANDYQP